MYKQQIQSGYNRICGPILNTQEFLRNNGDDLSKLTSELGIRVTSHPSKIQKYYSTPLVILNYSQIDSPNLHPVVKECRGLVLEDDTWNLVARAFPRFFNYGQYPEDDAKFDWSNTNIQEKVDGSLILLYWYNGKWRWNSRGSFGNTNIGASEYTWDGYCRMLVPDYALDHLVKGNTYVFEFCSRYNKIVVDYPKPTLYLLSVFHKENELYPYIVDDIYNDWTGTFPELQVNRPKTYQFHSAAEIVEWLSVNESADPTFEGFVVRDNNNNNRIKIKSPSYFLLHKTLNNGNIFLPKNLVYFILKNETDELELYWPELKPVIESTKSLMNEAKTEMLNTWCLSHRIASQKEFALFVIPRTKFSSILFQARKTNRHPEDIWNESEELIRRVLFNA